MKELVAKLNDINKEPKPEPDGANKDPKPKPKVYSPPEEPKPPRHAWHTARDKWIKAQAVNDETA
jgi:hypothetical protein